MSSWNEWKIWRCSDLKCVRKPTRSRLSLVFGCRSCSGRLVHSVCLCVQEEEYIEWMAAMKLACRGRTMADMPGYQSELHALRSLLRLHHSCPSPSPASPPLSAARSGGGADNSVAVRIADLVAARHLNRLRHKQVRFTSAVVHLALTRVWLIDWMR